ncbi:hypothetical protein [Paenibacillus crassostreae]|uniref:Uncharacterized protein n=1 Tax=Paenibacillus crassostreae TaxID=1763538 RepID=A0A167EJ82_9BACL|nr:hypothetical protein [Paenibacillus crassostreae]AOZ94913.1 hypothetical protein LPB68_21880 [Paenibacillus crassostreae]OAB75595.1 hypothetical protein PNBC_08170 [Paenibacillus crassostreae]
MDSTDIIAISKIASLIEEEKIIRTNNNSVWDKILSNAGQRKLYVEYQHNLNPFTYYNHRPNENPKFREFFTAIKSILQTVYLESSDNGEFQKLMEAIVQSIDFDIILMGDVTSVKGGFDYDTFKDFMENVHEIRAVETLAERATPAFKEFRLNLNILNLDLQFENKKLTLRHLTEDIDNSNKKASIVMEWLTTLYPLISKSYKEALENYSAGNPSACIFSCRNIITGIFSELKDDDTSWITGLQKISTDVNIKNIVAKNIPQGSANVKMIFDNVQQFKYPRFMVIYSLYSLTCDLGAHTHEAPKMGGVLHPEITTMNDALLCLRMTQDVLLWVKSEIDKL